MMLKNFTNVRNCKFRLTKFTFLLLLFPWVGLKSQNLLANPGAEDGPPATNGWTVVSSGSNCYSSGVWRVEGNQGGFPAAHSGNYYFYPGCTLLGALFGQTYELYQDVDVSADAAVIDLKGFGVTFSGYERSFNEFFPDGTTITVEARNSANSTVLGSYTTGETKTRTGWAYYAATSILPVGTRFIRVRLIGTVHSLGSIDSYFDDLSLKSLSVTPIKLSQFNVVKSGGKVYLNWQTVNELNNMGFTVMRSSDQINWSDLGFVANNYQSTPDDNEYSFEDRSPLGGRYFYKLRETSIDGSVKYSKVRTVLMNGYSSVKVYPNPAHNILNIQISNAPVSSEIIDVYGKSIERYDNIKKIDISNLAKGVYILKIATLDEVVTRKFVKR